MSLADRERVGGASCDSWPDATTIEQAAPRIDLRADS